MNGPVEVENRQHPREQEERPVRPGDGWPLHGEIERVRDQPRPAEGEREQPLDLPWPHELN